ncbi:GNAT family N-acetyltransferase [Variovorax sp. Root434]|uniref:GNAT family N-acetyltransferase n=1 Tax=Variovorax sp. Root434 TaxID=1736536 RepID=UPI0006FF9D00|nr:GNAT family N-acetyltransferase [Variovorax sp. Root434]KQX31944.1 hypothetical protein ASD05_27810 [Variovorax sp. Root434]
MHKAISTAEDTDAEQISALVNNAYRPSAAEAGWTHESALVSGERTSAVQVRRLFKKDSTVLVMKHDESIVACVHVERVNDVCWIGMLATKPDLQAGGLGKEMLAAAEALAASEHAPQALKMAVLSSRPELLSFYQRRGFVLNGNIGAYPADAGVGTPRQDGLQVFELEKKIG